MKASTRSRWLALVAGSALAVVCAEAILWAAGLPRFAQARRNEFTGGLDFAPSRTLAGYPMHRIRPGTRYLNVYADDPRGYFGPARTVAIQANPRGFRGAECTDPAPQGTLRIAFLGDSFTLGEGVHDADVYPVRAAALLAERLTGAARVEACNWGMLAFNTTQEWLLLEEEVLATRPDLLVLGVFLNDAARPYFTVDWRTNEVTQDGLDPAWFDLRRPPATWIYRSRLARLVWQRVDARRRERETVAYYAGLFGGSNPEWPRNRESLQAIVRACQSRGLPLVVLCFPVLRDLDATYPFADAHASVAGAVAEVAGPSTRFVDLLPRLTGRAAETLWVHPTDHHPNEIVHALTAEALVEAILEEPALLPR